MSETEPRIDADVEVRPSQDISIDTYLIPLLQNALREVRGVIALERMEKETSDGNRPRVLLRIRNATREQCLLIADALINGKYACRELMREQEVLRMTA